jgi:hypothetical protein
MPQAQIAQGVQPLDLMLEYFSDAGDWARGHYDDGNGGHCLVGALLHLSRKHHLPRAPAIALLQDARGRHPNFEIDIGLAWSASPSRQGPMARQQPPPETKAVVRGAEHRTAKVRRRLSAGGSRIRRGAIAAPVRS